MIITLRQSCRGGTAESKLIGNFKDFDIYCQLTSWKALWYFGNYSFSRLHSFMFSMWLSRRIIPQHNKSYIWQTHSEHYPQWWKIESISSKVRPWPFPSFKTETKDTHPKRKIRLGNLLIHGIHQLSCPFPFRRAMSPPTFCRPCPGQASLPVCRIPCCGRPCPGPRMPLEVKVEGSFCC